LTTATNREPTNNHELPVAIEGGHGRVYFSRVPQGEAVLFVHGFNGDAVGTWQSFPGILTREPRFASFDMYFLEYDSLWTKIEDNAADVHRFVDQLFYEPETFYGRFPILATQRRKELRYKKLTVIAHSMGSVVWRRVAIKQWLRQKQPGAARGWLAKMRFILFAPADNGANILSLAAACLGGIKLAWLEPLVAFFVRPLGDLREESPKLKELLRDSKEIYKKTPKLRSCVVARLVVRARNDRTVSDLRFFEDPDAEDLDSTHAGVCKPNDDFRAPVDLVLKALGE